MLFDTVAEYDEEITAVRETIRRQLRIGAEHANNSGGSSRSTKEIDLDQLKSYLTDLVRGRDELNGDGGPSKIGFNW